MLSCDLYTKSKSPSASRPHIVRKPPHDAPKDVDIKDYGLRVCGDYRRANDQLQKSFPSTANGTDELSKLPGYTNYWITDRFSMYNAYALRPGPSRELLAVHTPIGLIEPTRMVFGEMNAGTVACANTPATLMRLPHMPTYVPLPMSTTTPKALAPSPTSSKATAIFSPYVNRRIGR